MSEEVKNVPATKEQAKIVYLLYMVGLLFGITGIIGVVMAYINKGDAPEWLKTHYQFQIRTFWIGAIYIFLGSILSLVIIGWFVLLFWAVWLIIRSLKGMKALELEKPIENPTAWLF
ncbi:hypothetical protein [Shewanella sp. MEBiC00475]|uniref:DUF4870 family protein n=1 Tax=Shewanella sp. MEBiC00475 TaxID=2575361 RepID=UPI0010C0FB75|nr:hypothetical protein [Shewanella sp. MEBiC00475]